MLLSAKTVDKHITDMGITDIKRIGIGWSGIVYTGYYQHKNVAIKYTLSRIGRSRINKGNSSVMVNAHKHGITNINEIYIMTQLSHPNLMSAIKIFTRTDYKHLCGSVIIMKHASHNLTNYVMTSDAKIKLLYKLINVIHYLHTLNISHGDITPSNVLIIDNEPYLSDFGGCHFGSTNRINDIKSFGQLMLYVFIGINTYCTYYPITDKKYDDITRKLVSTVKDDTIKDLLKLTLIDCKYTLINQLLDHKVFSQFMIDTKISSLTASDNVPSLSDEVYKICKLHKSYKPHKLLRLLADHFEYRNDERKQLDNLIVIANYLYLGNKLLDKHEITLIVACFWIATKMIFYSRIPFNLISSCLKKAGLHSECNFKQFLKSCSGISSKSIINELNVSQAEAEIISRLKIFGK